MDFLLRKVINDTFNGGQYKDLHPLVSETTAEVDFTYAVNTLDATASPAVTTANLGSGRSTIVRVYTNKVGTPTFGTEVIWAYGSAPVWTEGTHVLVALHCLNDSKILASATTYTVPAV